MKKYQLPYKAKEVEEILDNANVAVTYTEQTLTPEQRAQVRENIGVSTYYSTTREEIGVSHEDINSEYIWGLYDALGLQRTEVKSNDGTFTNYVYEISTGEYNASGLFAEVYGSDPHIKKPKYLILSGIHGKERKTVFSTYRFIRDLLNGHNVPKAFADGAIIRVLPVANPSGFDAFTRGNNNGVDINRNFTSDTPAKETQAIENWISTNTDAELFMDVHNNSTVNEIVCVFGANDNDVADTAKKVALRGVDRIIPYWRDVIGYPLTLKAPYLDENGKLVKDGDNYILKDMPVIYSYSASTNESLAGTVLCCASNLGIPSISVELSTYYGDYDEWEANPYAYPPETIAMGAEAIGNILLEFYEQAFFSEVSDEMKAINNKIDRALSFHTESGYVEIANDYVPATTIGKDESFSIPASNGNVVITANSKATGITIKIPCANGAKTIDFHAEDEKTGTLSAIRRTQNIRYVGSFLGNFYASGVQTGLYTNNGMRSFMTAMKYDAEIAAMTSLTEDKRNNGWVMDIASPSTSDNTDGVSFSTYALKAGRYEWTAYYWND